MGFLLAARLFGSGAMAAHWRSWDARGKKPPAGVSAGSLGLSRLFKRSDSDLPAPPLPAFYEIEVLPSAPPASKIVPPGASEELPAAALRRSTRVSTRVSGPLRRGISLLKRQKSSHLAEREPNRGSLFRSKLRETLSRPTNGHEQDQPSSGSSSSLPRRLPFIGPETNGHEQEPSSSSGLRRSLRRRVAPVAASSLPAESPRNLRKRNASLFAGFPSEERQQKKARPSDQRFPSAPWAQTMLNALRHRVELAKLDLQSRPIRLGTDCSGAEAPFFALQEIQRVLAEQASTKVSVHHVFSCDVNKDSRNFIRRNCAPDALFADLLERKSNSSGVQVGDCLLQKRPRQVASDLDIYVAGFPCKDFSMLNSSRSCLGGPNSAIYRGVVAYIETHRPATFILENVSGIAMKHKGEQAPIYTVMTRLRSIPGYQVKAWTVNTQDFQLPQNRKRVYIIGVNLHKAQLTVPLNSWTSFLDGFKQFSSLKPEAFLLKDTEPEVQEVLNHLKSRKATREIGAGSALRGFRWKQHHRLVREKLKGASRKMEGGWSKFLSPRMQECLELAALRTAARMGCPAEETEHVSEISRGIMYCSSMCKVTPCVTPSSKLWSFRRWRWMVGIELLALQGFPVDRLDLTGLSDASVSLLAGNAMSVPVVGAFLYLLLAFVVFPQQPGAPEVRTRTHRESFAVASPEPAASPQKMRMKRNDDGQWARADESV